MQTILNRLWRVTCRREAEAFRRDIQRPAEAQSRVLTQFLRLAAGSEWGSRWKLRASSSTQEFQRVVPLTNYADYLHAIGQIDRSGSNPLTSERVMLLEPTSGTNSGSKLIPYTPALRFEFQRALAVWIDDLFTKRPAVMRGPAYWALSPPAHRREHTRSGIAIGYDDDTAYLGTVTRMLASQLLAVPTAMSRLAHPGDWQYATAWYLVQSQHLALISVWSPTFLLEILRQLAGPLRSKLARDLFDARPRLPSGALPESPMLPVRWSRKRWRCISRQLDSDCSTADLTTKLWPHLAGISCWTDGASARYIPALQQSFPHAEILPKSLLSTEGCVSIPIVDAPGGALALRSHFLEFLPAGRGSSALLAHELSPGTRYHVVITTGGGLYRYRTGDWVEVTGMLGRCPLVRFMGREATSDLVGEKISDQFVQATFERLFAPGPAAPAFALLVPDAPNRCYHLFAEVAGMGDTEFETTLAHRLDRLLSDNPYYFQARQLGQLQMPTAVVDFTGASSFQQHFIHASTAVGIRPGSTKAVAVETNALRAAEFLRLCGKSDARTPVPAASRSARQ